MYCGWLVMNVIFGFVKRNEAMPTNAVLKGLVALVCGALAARAAGNISAVWANNGDDKVTQEQLRASNGQNVMNFLWDGTRINQFGARNEMVEFELILEAKTSQATNVDVIMSSLTGPGGGGPTNLFQSVADSRWIHDSPFRARSQIAGSRASN